MSESIDAFLHSERSGGSAAEEGSFSINLREAARKMALFGQQQQGAWTLKFGQAFCRLGCHTLEITRTSERWRLDGEGAERSLDPAGLRRCLGKLGLGGSQEAEDFLAVGLSALSVPATDGNALEAAWWVENFEVEPLLGELEHVPEQMKGPTLILQFPKDSSPPLPRSLWENSFCYSTMSVFYKTGPSSGIHLNNQYSSQFMAEGRELLWIEYLGEGETTRDLTLTPTGKPLARLGEEVKDTTNLNTTSQIRWKGVTPRKRSIVILGRKELQGPTEIYPVVAGCLLRPVTVRGLCDGFKLVVTADDCPTDLGHNQLRQSPELDNLVESCKPALQHAIELMQLTVQSDKSKHTVVNKPKTPLAADAAPGFMGCLWLFTVPVLFSEPILGTILSLMFGGPPGLYFWYSRRQRGKEYETLKADAGKALDTRLKQLNESPEA